MLLQLYLLIILNDTDIVIQRVALQEQIQITYQGHLIFPCRSPHKPYFKRDVRLTPILKYRQYHQILLRLHIGQLHRQSLTISSKLKLKADDRLAIQEVSQPHQPLLKLLHIPILADSLYHYATHLQWFVMEVSEDYLVGVVGEETL